MGMKDDVREAAKGVAELQVGQESKKLNFYYFLGYVILNMVNIVIP